MGQQQLLLLVLGIVIVGLAVVVGINAFSENRTKSNADAMVTDGLRIASDIQAWALKPTQFGGGGGAAALPDVDFAAIGYPTSGGTTTEYTNVNGTFTLAQATGCDTDPGGSIYVNGNNADTGNNVCIGIAGTSADDINTVVDYGNQN